MEVIIKESAGIHFSDVKFGEIFCYDHFHCIKIFNCDTDESVGLILDDGLSYMETLRIDDDEVIYQQFPNSKLIIE